jgi:hypothetical protein
MWKKRRSDMSERQCKPIKLVEYEFGGTICFGDHHNMAETFSNQISSLNASKLESEYKEPVVNVKFHDGSSIYFLIFEDKVGFRIEAEEIKSTQIEGCEE